jgi:hypothetical protein
MSKVRISMLFVLMVLGGPGAKADYGCCAPPPTCCQDASAPATSPTPAFLWMVFSLVWLSGH